MISKIMKIKDHTIYYLYYFMPLKVVVCFLSSIKIKIFLQFKGYFNNKSIRLK